MKNCSYHGCEQCLLMQDQAQLEAAVSPWHKKPSIIYAIPFILDPAASQSLFGHDTSTALLCTAAVPMTSLAATDMSMLAADSAEANKPLRVRHLPLPDAEAAAPSAAALPSAHNQTGQAPSHTSIHIHAHQQPAASAPGSAHDTLLAKLPSVGLNMAQCVLAEAARASDAAAVTLPLTVHASTSRKDRQDPGARAGQAPSLMAEGSAKSKQPAASADPGAHLGSGAHFAPSGPAAHMASRQPKAGSKAAKDAVQAADASHAEEMPLEASDMPSAAASNKAKGPGNHAPLATNAAHNASAGQQPVAKTGKAQGQAATNANAAATQSKDAAKASGPVHSSALAVDPPAHVPGHATVGPAQSSAKARARRAASKPASSAASAASEGQQQPNEQLPISPVSKEPQQPSTQQPPAARQQSQKSKESQSPSEQPALNGKRLQQQQTDPASQPAVKKRKHSPILPPAAVAQASKAAGGAHMPAKTADQTLQPSGKASTAEKIADEDRGLPQCTLDSIYNSLKELGLLKNRKATAQLSRRDIIQLGEAQSPLVQLRVLSHYGRKFDPRGNPISFLKLTTGFVGNADSRLAAPARPVTLFSSLRSFARYELSSDAKEMLHRLGRFNLLQPDAVPELTAQVLPEELQPAFLLALAGYKGKHLARFSSDLLQRILWQVCWIVHQRSRHPEHFDAVAENFHRASGKQFRPPPQRAAAKPKAKPEPDQAIALAPNAVPPKASSRPSSGLSEAAREKTAPAATAMHKPIPFPESASRPSKQSSNHKAAVPPANESRSMYQTAAAAKPSQHDKGIRESGIRPEPQEAKTRERLSITDVRRKALFGMNVLKVLRSRSLDDVSQNSLVKQAPLWQLRSLSIFASNIRPNANPSAMLTSILKSARPEPDKWVHQRVSETEENAHKLLSDAVAARMFPARLDAFPALRRLTPDLHAVAVIYAVGCVAVPGALYLSQSMPQQHQPSCPAVLAALHAFVQYAQQLIKDFMSRDSPSTALRPPLGPSRPPSAPSDPRLYPTGPPQNPHSPSHPQTSSSCDLPANPHRQPQLQQSTSNTHLPGPGKEPKPCRYYYRSSGRGCDRRDCPFLHGSHAEYVSYMSSTGLLPYGLKFQAQKGRDRWVIDGAVDVLNTLITRGRIPRGSLADWDLRPLAFLEDPLNGEPSKLQLQVSTLACCLSPVPHAFVLFGLLDGSICCWGAFRRISVQ